GTAWAVRTDARRATLRCDVVLLQNRGRVHRFAAPRTYLQVQVRPGNVAGRADRADRLARIDLLARADGDRALVAVPDLGAVLELYHGLVPVRAVEPGRGHGPTRDRDDLGSAGGGEVQAGVHGGPQPAGLAEGRGDS